METAVWCIERGAGAHVPTFYSSGVYSSGGLSAQVGPTQESVSEGCLGNEVEEKLCCEERQRK